MEEFQILFPYIERELGHRSLGTANPDKLAARAFDIFFASKTLFEIADQSGQILRWLNSDEEIVLNTMVFYLRWQTERHAGRIAELIEPFIGKDEAWRLRIRSLMEWGHLERNRHYFDLFLRMLREGYLDDARDRMATNGTFWSMLYGLAEHEPTWCAELAAVWLDRQISIERAENNSIDLHPALSDDAGTDDLFVSARGDPAAFLHNVIPAILRAATACVIASDEKFPHDRLWSLRFDSQYIGLADAYTAAAKVAFELQGNRTPASLRPLIDELKSARLISPWLARWLIVKAFEPHGASLIVYAWKGSLRFGHLRSLLISANGSGKSG